jgi:uncharacterized delta-60 repeat protein
MSHFLRCIRAAAAVLLVALAACGGGGGSDTDTPPTGAVIGAAGGTVTGPGGAKVVIPPGALSTDTPIAIEQTTAGSPPLPGGLSASGSMFAFTPHGTKFAVPVTVTLPFDAAAATASVTPALYKTNAQGQWERVVGATFAGDSVTATITSFSHAEVIILPLQRSEPVREWEFGVFWSDGSETVVAGPNGRGTQIGGLFEKIAEFGPMPLDSEFSTFTGTALGDSRANGFAFGTADGVTYGVFGEAPFGKLGGINQPGGPNPIGSRSRLDQRQSFIKRTENAMLTFTITVAQICAFDYNLFPPTFGLDDDHTRIRGNVGLDVQAWTKQQRTFFAVSGAATVSGTRTKMSRGVQNFAAGFTTRELWNEESFDFSSEFPIPGDTALQDGGLGLGREGCLELKGGGTLTHTVDLSSVAVGEEFTLRTVAEALTENRRGGGAIDDHQASGVVVYLRDPLGMGGATVTFVGLEPSNQPDAAPPVPAPVVPASCVPGPAPDPAAGMLHFSAASYTIGESAAALQTITVARSGGSRGAVTANFATTGGGTAVAGADYTPVATTVFFADGEAAPRTVVVPIINNTVDAPNKTVNLMLSQPGGCAALGAQTTAMLTIEDDDQPPLATLPTGIDTGFGVAGKATLERFGGDRSGMALQADGKVVLVGGTFTDFILARFNADGSVDRSFGVDGKVTTDMGSGLRQEEALAVAIQSDGKIVVAGHTAIDATPPARDPSPTFAIARYNSDGSLDTTFGTGGRVSNNVNGRAFAVAIQPDGKIVLAGEFAFESTNGSDFSDFTVARFLADGRLDTTFGPTASGQVAVDLGGTNSAHHIALQPDGAIVVSGKPEGSTPGFDRTDIARFNANGSLDASFGVGGKLTLAGVDVGQGLVRQADGKLVLVGTIVETTAPITSRFALMRRNADGSPDASFGTAGTATTALSENASAGGIALQVDGKLVVVGTRAFSVNTNFVVARYNGNGSLDTGFGNAGVLSIDFFGFDDTGESVLMQPDGKIVVGGKARNVVDGYGLARINP